MSGDVVRGGHASRLMRGRSIDAGAAVVDPWSGEARRTTSRPGRAPALHRQRGAPPALGAPSCRPPGGCGVSQNVRVEPDESGLLCAVLQRGVETVVGEALAAITQPERCRLGGTVPRGDEGPQAVLGQYRHHLAVELRRCGPRVAVVPAARVPLPAMSRSGAETSGGNVPWPAPRRHRAGQRRMRQPAALELGRVARLLAPGEEAADPVAVDLDRGRALALCPQAQLPRREQRREVGSGHLARYATQAKGL